MERLAAVLAITGLAALLVSTAASYSLLVQAGSLLASTLPLVACSQGDDGQFILAAPTSAAGCSAILDMKADSLQNACDSMEPAKRESCRQLMQLAGVRTADCIEYATQGTTSFPLGAGQAAGWCAALLAE